jgi:hypothetical protein
VVCGSHGGWILLKLNLHFVISFGVGVYRVLPQLPLITKSRKRGWKHNQTKCKCRLWNDTYRGLRHVNKVRCDVVN